MKLEIVEAIKVWSQFAHPILMWILLGITIYALYLGIQIRRTRNADKDLRKELVKKKFNTKHHQIGALLLALMVLGSIVGMGVTYINNGKLFVEAHLLAGLGMTAIIAISASLVPLMQQGNQFARNTHAILGIILLGLFSWETVTGMDILQKIISKF
ncbi:MAG: DUF4079 domain-containing protein [Prochloraceae cyanobacterium]|nr:DUF4079 domain-containing protein [Prochloraceae cyanobacterium]